MEEKYALNLGRGTVHIIRKCRETKRRVPDEYKRYETYEALVKEQGEYVKKCKNCFRNE